MAVLCDLYQWAFWTWEVCCLWKWNSRGLIMYWLLITHACFVQQCFIHLLQLLFTIILLCFFFSGRRMACHLAYSHYYSKLVIFCSLLFWQKTFCAKVFCVKKKEKSFVRVLPAWRSNFYQLKHSDESYGKKICVAISYRVMGPPSNGQVVGVLVSNLQVEAFMTLFTVHK